MSLDDDLSAQKRDELLVEVRRLRAGVRAHRDSTGHDLRWRHPAQRGLPPEPLAADLAVPAWPQFLRGCVSDREALDREMPDTRRTAAEADAGNGGDQAS